MTTFKVLKNYNHDFLLVFQFLHWISSKFVKGPVPLSLLSVWCFNVDSMQLAHVFLSALVPAPV